MADNNQNKKDNSDKKVTKKRKLKISIAKAHANIHSSFNNTIITICNEKGETITWSSGGSLGYKGSKKSTPYAAQLAADACAKVLKDLGISEVSVTVRGVGPGREASIRGLQGAGIIVTSVKDVTPVPFNGCRRPKAPTK